MEKLEILVTDIEQHTPKTRGMGRTSCAVRVIPTVMHSASIVEHCEQADHLFNGSAARGYKQTVALNSTPV
ncbi:MAG: hypothetical protein EBS05_03250 [Proteobacteria bacterium]|nr:hypothetical protein [Pseudomonadota bacterium]